LHQQLTGTRKERLVYNVDGTIERTQPMKKNLNRDRIVTFRVTEDEYAGIANASLAADDEPNSWCRNVALSSINKAQTTIDNRAIYTEIACLRHLFSHGFNILFSNDSNALKASAWDILVKFTNDHANAIYEQLLKDRLRRRQG
jgi:hypothetical protein